MTTHSSDVTVRVSMVPTGELYIPDGWVIHGADPKYKRLYPDYSFLIRHPSARSVMFDLGIRKVGASPAATLGWESGNY